MQMTFPWKSLFVRASFRSVHVRAADLSQRTMGQQLKLTVRQRFPYFNTFSVILALFGVRMGERSILCSEMGCSLLPRTCTRKRTPAEPRPGDEEGCSFRVLHSLRFVFFRSLNVGFGRRAPALPEIR